MKKFLQSFKYAYDGLTYAFSTQLNFKVHVSAAIVAIFLGWFFKISGVEWMWICCAVASVIVGELINTALEILVDLVSPEKNQKAGAIKDIAAASVLILAIFALTIGFIIFLPKIIAYVA